MHMSARAHALRISALTYPGSIEHVSTVRADLRALLRDCPVTDDVILCASELAANAVRHSRSRLSGGTFTVRAAVDLTRRSIRVEVEDHGGPWTTAPDEPTGHHGLDILRALAKSGASTATTRPALSGPASIGPSSRC
jgi:anti-sigma regulatory factor (Ser/Thr protein kinase)